MSKKFCVLIEDDWEVLGNGLGNVAYHQYAPSLVFMKMAKRLGIRLTFMVEVAQQLVYQKTKHTDYNLTLQKKLWDENVILMNQYGFDVQLHLHPQWHNAILKDDYFHLSNVWNIGLYEKDVKASLIRESVTYLESLLRPFDPDYKVIAYKGGSWGLQPSEDLLNSLSENGIRIVMGVRKNMKIPKMGLDYMSLEEGTLPYYPLYKDINKVSDRKEDIVVIPLQPYSPDIFTMAGLGIDAVKMKFSRKDSVRHFYEQHIPGNITSLSPLHGRNKLKFGYRPYDTHLKIGNQPFNYLKNSFNNVINRLKNVDSARIPIVIECHTKQYHTYYRDIEKFLDYVQNQYHDILDFGDMTSFYREISNNEVPIKIKNGKS
jgi:hypothetical protein